MGIVKDISPGWKSISSSPAYFLAVILHCVGDSNVDYSSDVVTVNLKAKCNGHKRYEVDTCSLH